MPKLKFSKEDAVLLYIQSCFEKEGKCSTYTHDYGDTKNINETFNFKITHDESSDIVRRFVRDGCLKYYYSPDRDNELSALCFTDKAKKEADKLSSSSSKNFAENIMVFFQRNIDRVIAVGVPLLVVVLTAYIGG